MQITDNNSGNNDNTNDHICNGTSNSDNISFLKSFLCT